MNDIIYWIWLSLVCKYNYNISEKLLLNFNNDAKKIYNATDSELEEIFKKRVKSFPKDLEEAKNIYSYCEKNNVGILHAGHEYYPRRLLRIENKPVLLYYMGKIPDIDSKLCIACVGTRRMTEYGKRLAYTISYDLSRSGAVIVSGMAEGVDSICHRAAIDAFGETIAVFGCGIDVVYPKFNENLMNELIARGTIMTEYHPGTPPNSQNFPNRNRIMSGISEGTVVIEANNGSGSLITAKHALHQGKNVYAVPGNIGEANSAGTNDLIRKGAKIITDAYDILNDYNDLYKLYKNNNFTRQAPIITKKYIPEPKNQPYVNNKNKNVNNKTTKNINITADISDNQKTNDNNNDANNNYQKRRERPKIIVAGGDNTNTEPLKLPSFDKIRLSEKEELLYSYIPEDESVSTDKLFGRGLSTADVLTALTNLEIKGYITTAEHGKLKRNK